MKYDERACKFNMDTGCVELLLRDGRKISIDRTEAGGQRQGVLLYHHKSGRGKSYLVPMSTAQVHQIAL